MFLKSLISATALTLLLIPAASQAQTQEQQRKEMAAHSGFCLRLHRIGADMDLLRQMGPESTVADVKDQVRRIEDDMKVAKKAAGKSQELKARVANLEQAYKSLKDSVQKIPEDATLAEVHSNIMQSQQRLQQAYDNVTEVCR